MKESVARQHLRNMLKAIQEYQANTKDTFQGSDDLLAQLMPWIFGTRCPVPALRGLVESPHLEPADYVNMMVVLYRFMPEILPLCFHTGSPIPQEPDFHALAGWEPE